MKNAKQDESGKIRVFCRYIVKNGKRIYPKKSLYFSFLVDCKKNSIIPLFRG
nr:MAG TPA: Spindle pole body-associated protein VIK1 motor domain-like fold, Microtubule.42A [Caudoviricetes sp.]